MATVVKTPPGIPIFNDGTENRIYSQIMQSADALRGHPEEILIHIEKAIEEQGAMIALEMEKVEWIHKYLESRKPKVILELGTYIGVSTMGFASLLRKCHGDDLEGCKVYTCEYSPKLAQVARGFIELAGLSDLVQVFEGAAADSVKKLVDEHPNIQADVIFFDHWKDYYLPDLRLCEDLGMLHKGSVVIADNTDWPGAPDFVNYVKTGGWGGGGSVQYTSETIPIVDPPRPNHTDVLEVSTVVDAP